VGCVAILVGRLLVTLGIATPSTAACTGVRGSFVCTRCFLVPLSGSGVGVLSAA
jgi:hypothetical protein